MISIRLKNKKESIEKIFWDWFHTYHLKEFLEILSNDVVLQNLIFRNGGKYLIWKNDIYKYKKNDYTVLKEFFFSSPEEHFKYCERMKNVKISNASESFFCNKYENFRKSQIPKIIQVLDIHACPYCNRNFIDVYYDKKSTKPNKFNGDIDHYFPKSKYKYLALCLYNLIPSCKTCNHEKGDKDEIDFYPFHPYMDDDSTYRFKTDFDLESEITDFDYLYGLSEKFNIKIFDYFGENSIEKSISTFHLDDKYKNMTLFAKNIIRKAYIYNSGYLDYFISQYKNILSKEEVIRILFDYDGENFLDKPLSKFKSDLMKEFDVI